MAASTCWAPTSRSRSLPGSATGSSPGWLRASSSRWCFGYLLEWAFFSFLYERDHLQQVLLTYALILVFEEGRSLLVGNDVHGVAAPTWLAGSFRLGELMSYPWYRVFSSLACIVVAVGLYAVVNRTRLGMMIRAGASNRDMVRGLGVDIRLLYRIVFAGGVALGGTGRHDRRALVVGLSGHGLERAHHLLRRSSSSAASARSPAR